MSPNPEANQNQAQTMILRFRDLVTQPHGTIASHQEIIATKKSVWWGWWSKQGEQVPVNLFHAMNQKLQKSPVQIYLFDSGYLALYKTNLLEIRFGAARDRIGSPDDSLTPAYYKDQKYLAWFKLDLITECEKDELLNSLHQCSYVRVDEFFESAESKYSRFYDKKVCSAEELQQQDRTIWFVRKYRNTDASNEISLLDSETLKPTHFVERYEQTESLKLLWISDLHFSEKLENHRFPKYKEEPNRPLLLALEDAINSNKIGRVAAVVCSGDMTWRASKEEFGSTSLFVKEFASRGRLRNYSFGFCPGNHDIRFSKDPAEKGLKVEVAKDDAKEEYSAFYREHFYQSPNEFLVSGRRYLLGNAKPVEIAYLNSNYLDQTPELFQGHGFVGNDQLKFVATGMGWNEDNDTKPKPYRIVVMHHHLVPVTYRDDAKTGNQYSVLLDAEAVVQWLLSHRVDLVLHGHMHQPFVTKISRSIRLTDDPPKERSLTIAGMGSTGVSFEHLGEIRENTFGIIDFYGNSPSLTVYSLDPKNESEELFSRDL